jgi:hypothetical protein
MSDQLFIEENSTLITEILLQVQEETVDNLFALKGQQTAEEFDNMGAIIKKEVVNGIIAGSPTSTVLEAVRGQGALSRRQLQTVIDTAMNEYSRSVTKIMIDKMPEDTKYVYIGALDEKTRPECLEMMAAGECTKKQIDAFNKKFPNVNNVFVNGGGYNCRHKWEIALQDKFGHDPDGAKKIIDESKN